MKPAIRLLSVALIVLAAVLSGAAARAEGVSAERASSRAADLRAIAGMAGCYDVQYQYAETFPLRKDYEIHAPYRTGGLEWIVVDGQTDHSISLQHILVGDDGTPLKHWRQDWKLEPKSVLEYRGEGVWATRQLDAGESTGRWVQQVTQVDDSPRYGCAAPWLHWGTHHFWECESWDPLPRRESARKDYNVLVRRNRHELRSYGWIQEEDNVKLKVDTEKHEIVDAIVREKGENTYRRTDAVRCAPAQKFWSENAAVWHAIQDTWREIYAEADSLRFKPSIDGQTLWEKLFEVAAGAGTGPSRDVRGVKNKARAEIERYLIK